MKVALEVGRMFMLVIVMAFLVAFLWQAPWFLAAVLLVPLAMAWWWWPHPSTALSYVVGAILGTLLSAWSYMSVVEAPTGFPLQFLWLPLVWGPAGVIVKRIEIIAQELWGRKSKKKYKLPDFES